MAKNAAAAILLGALALLLTLPVGVTAASSSEDVKKESKEAWAAFKDYLHDQKHDAVEYGRKQLKKADAEIEELEGKADKAYGEAKDEYHQTIKNLKKLRAEAGKKLDELENSSGDAWDASKEGFVKAYEDLYDAYKDAKAKF
jgi:hypothetical protein